MKKKFYLFILLFTIIISGCSRNSSEYPSTGINMTLKDLPSDMKLNDSKLTLKDISLYQSYYNYEWYVYATITLDISDLTEQEKHWIDKDATETFDSDKIINPDIYLTCEDNLIDSDSMAKYGYADIDDCRIFFFGKSTTYKNDFKNSEINASISIQQDETYKSTSKDGKEYSLNKYNDYSYKMKDIVKDINVMPKEILEAFNDKISSML